MTEVRNPDYYPQLDAVRTVAVLMVVVHHWLEGPSVLHLGGAMGVGLFFVLSGFLITGILMKQQEAFQSGLSGIRQRILKTFYIRRTLRIFPIYYLYTGALIVLGIGQAREIWPWLLGYAYNFLLFFSGDWYSGYVEHLWSLAIEEQYYLIWPLMLLATPPRYTLRLILAFILTGLAAKTFLYLNAPASQYSKFPLCQFDAFGIGSLLAWWHRQGKSIPFAAAAMWLFWTLALAFPLKWFPFHFRGLSLIGQVSPFFYLGCALFIHQAAKGIRGPIGFVFNQPFILFLGRISYGIYLYHLFVPDLVRYAFFRSGLEMPGEGLRWMMYSLLTLGICVFSWYAVEQPINRLKERFSYR